MRSTLFTALLTGSLCGCGGVLSQHPASDEATTRIDERLLGIWRAEEGTATAGEPGAPQEEAVLVIGRVANDPRALRAVAVVLKKDRTLETSTADVRATALAGSDYASARLTGKEEGPSWILLRYQSVDADTVRVLGMDEDALATDVRAGVIAGKVAESKGSADAKPTLTVTLEAETSVLRAYLEKRGDAIYRKDHPLVLHRVRGR